MLFESRLRIVNQNCSVIVGHNGVGHSYQRIRWENPIKGSVVKTGKLQCFSNFQENGFKGFSFYKLLLNF